MIYVLLKPETLWQKIKFHLFGTVPARACPKIRYGGGAVEMVYPEEDACTSLPVNRVFEIQWDSGYSQDLAEAREEYLENVSSAMPDVAAAIPNDPDPMDCL